jgi:hypothetical protein
VFDTGFVESILEWVRENDHVTGRDRWNVENIIEKFKIP